MRVSVRNRLVHTDLFFSREHVHEPFEVCARQCPLAAMMRLNHLIDKTGVLREGVDRDCAFHPAAKHCPGVGDESALCKDKCALETVVNTHKECI